MSKAFSPSYLEGTSEALPFLPLDFRQANDRKAAVEQAAQRPCDPRLVAILRRQNEVWGLSSSGDHNLRLLEQSGTVVVATGQQVGLFLGPLYTFYKAASAIAVARALQKETSHPAVPIFWLQTEDHDFEEIRTTHLPQPTGGPLQLEMPHDAETSEPRYSVQHRELAPTVQELTDTLASRLDSLPYAEEALHLFQKHYKPGTSWSDAFAGVLAACFAKEGLLLLNPRDPEVAALGSYIHKQAITHEADIEAALTQRVHELEAAGFEAQIAVREDCTLSFFHPENEEGDRYRLLRDGDNYKLAGYQGSYTLEALLEVLRSQPLRFSTSALLRPLLQDHLFPTAAYVGGPGELSYFAQLEPLYQWFKRPMPMIMPRGRFLVVNKDTHTILQQWDLSVDDALQSSEQELLARLQDGTIEGIRGVDIRQRAWEPLAQSFATMESDIVALEPNLDKTLARTLGSIENALDKLGQKIERVQLYQNTSLVQELKKVRSLLSPNGQPQERFYSLPYFVACCGLSSLKQAVWDTYTPFSYGVEVLYP